MAPAGGTMLGMSRTVIGDATREYEYLRLHVDDGRPVYTALPSGQRAADFAAVTASDTLLVFENPEHDFPQRVIYRRVGSDSLIARIEGERDGRTRGGDFPMRRVRCETGDVSRAYRERDFSQGTHVILLGTGTPNADPERSGPAVAVVANGRSYLVDAGPGVVRRAAQAAEWGVAALGARNLKCVFITHLHSDHTVGLADLIFTPWVLERDVPLAVYGPRGVAAMAEHLVRAYDADVRRRIDGLQPQNATGYHVRSHEVEAGPVYRDEHVRVTAFRVDHEDWPDAFGYRFETADRVIVISGDARPSETIVTACNGCDVLVHEVFSDAGFARRAPEWRRYHASAHTSASDLGRLAARARPRVLVLYHQLPWGSSPQQILNEVRSTYDGKVVYGNDLDVF